MLLLFQILVCIISTSSGAKVKPAKSISALQQQASALQDKTTTLAARMTELQRTTFDTTDGNAVVVVDATIGGYTTKCGPQTVTGWTEVLDKYYVQKTTTLSTTTSFNPSTGTFTPPITGYYKICISFRARNTGNAVDVTLLKDGTPVAALGSALQSDWRTMSVCTIQLVTSANAYTVKLQSGGSSDCLEETSWYYSRFSAHLIACNAATCV
eukprot:GFUD01030002.1.p1 GENE.GFUD01030002.1~~GFUD01030002.1.p1  ORF type:complete len:212 (+),score=38.43 GFUD01030002.1:2-637(+)